MRLRIAFVVIFAAVIASSVQAARCIKCDQTTGYACFMAQGGTHSGCDTPSNAGCALWGTCTANDGGGDDDCGEHCVLDIGNAAPMTNDLEVASVTIAVPASRPRSLPTTNAQTAI